MGKASKWFRGLFGLKKPDSPSLSSPPPPPLPSHSQPKLPKRRWSFVKSQRDKHCTPNSASVDDVAVSRRSTPYGDTHRAGDDQSKHAIAVAAATAAVADAAVAAAQAAAEVVRLTSSGLSNGAAAEKVPAGGFGSREEWAAVKIQSNFRAYLARRALRALKALVKLQALVRGHIMRKQTADVMRRMQALLRAQARARSGRSLISESPQSSSKGSHFHHPGPPTPEKFEHVMRTKSTKYDQQSILKRNGSKSHARVMSGQDKAGFNGPIDDEKIDKILEIDTGKPHVTPKRRTLFHSSHHATASDQNSRSQSYTHSCTTSKGSTIHHTVPSPSSCEVNSLTPLRFTHDVEEISFCTADDSPQFYSASSKSNGLMRGPFTPNSKSDSRSCLSGFLDHPNYMAYTESSRAKVRSLSAPRQRSPQFEVLGTTKRHSVYGFGDSRSGTQRISAMHAFASRAYPGSGRLNSLGMPVAGGGDAARFSGGGGYLNRY